MTRARLRWAELGLLLGWIKAAAAAGGGTAGFLVIVGGVGGRGVRGFPYCIISNGRVRAGHKQTPCPA